MNERTMKKSIQRTRVNLSMVHIIILNYDTVKFVSIKRILKPATFNNIHTDQTTL